MTNQILVCPDCFSKDVAVTSESLFNANTQEYIGEMVKPHDLESKACCLSCNWEGQRFQLLNLKD